MLSVIPGLKMPPDADIDRFLSSKKAAPKKGHCLFLFRRPSRRLIFVKIQISDNFSCVMIDFMQMLCYVRTMKYRGSSPHHKIKAGMYYEKRSIR